MNKIITDFLNNKISIDVIKNEFETNSLLEEYLESLLPKSRDISLKEWDKYNYAPYLMTNNFNVKKTIDMLGTLETTRGKRNAYDLLFEIMSNSGEQIKKNNPFVEAREFLIDNVPSYIGGLEAEKYIDEIYQSLLGKNMSKKELIKTFKNTLKEKFRYTSKPPFWIQEPEWPFFEGRPMVYESRHPIGDVMIYVFSDEDSGMCTEVTQIG